MCFAAPLSRYLPCTSYDEQGPIEERAPQCCPLMRIATSITAIALGIITASVVAATGNLIALAATIGLGIAAICLWPGEGRRGIPPSLAPVHRTFLTTSPFHSPPPIVTPMPVAVPVPVYTSPPLESQIFSPPVSFPIPVPVYTPPRLEQQIFSAPAQYNDFSGERRIQPGSRRPTVQSTAPYAASPSIPSFDGTGERRVIVGSHAPTPHPSPTPGFPGMPDLQDERRVPIKKTG